MHLADRAILRCKCSIKFYFIADDRMTEPSIDKIAFNDEVGQMMGWSLPVISIPCMVVSGYAFWLLMKGIKQFTGLSMEEVLAQAPQPKRGS